MATVYYTDGVELFEVVRQRTVSVQRAGFPTGQREERITFRNVVTEEETAELKPDEYATFRPVVAVGQAA